MSGAVAYSRGRDKFDAHPAQRTAATFDDFERAVLSDRAPAKGRTYIAAPFKRNGDGRPHRCKEGALPRAWLAFDLDGVRDATALVDLCLWLQRFRGFSYTTWSHKPDAPRVRLILAASRSVDRAECQRASLAIEAAIKRELGDDVAKFDPSVYRGEQPCYLAPADATTYRFDGAPVDVDMMLQAAPPLDDERPGVSDRAREMAERDPIMRNLVDNGMVKRELEPGRFAVVCPCEAEHTSESGDTATIYMLPNFGGVLYGKFHCLHAHCDGRPQEAFIAALGLEPKRVWKAQANGGADMGADGRAAETRRDDRGPDDTEIAGGDADAPAGLHSRLVGLDNLHDAEPHPHYVERVLPMDEVTLLGGHGGLGKSYLALLLALHLAAGRAFGPLAVQQTRVLFYSAEDGARTLRHRVKRLCDATGIDPARLPGRLLLLDMSDDDAALHRESVRYIAGTKYIDLTTSTLVELAALVGELDPGVVIVDGASDAYDDDEISRSRVRAFLRSLRQRIARPGRAVLLLAHVNKLTAKAGGEVSAEAYSGSTAWHNSVRSRLALTGDPGGQITLTHQKATHGPLADAILLEFRDGVPALVSTGPLPAGEMLARQQQERDGLDQQALLQIIAGFEARGERVTTAAQGGMNVHRLLVGEPGFPANTPPPRLMRLLRDLESSGRLFRCTVRTPDRKLRECFRTAPILDLDDPQASDEGAATAV